MNRQQAKDMLPIIQALAEGKHIQLKDLTGNWIDVNFINVEICNPNYYRIKPEPKYRPFKDAEECWQEMLKHQPFGWLINKADNTKFQVVMLKPDTLVFVNGDNRQVDYYFHSYFYDNCTFADGTPFGIKEE